MLLCSRKSFERVFLMFLIEHRNGCIAFNQALQISTEFGQKISKIRKEDFGPLYVLVIMDTIKSFNTGCRGPSFLEPHFACGKVNLLSQFMGSYTLLQDIYVVIFQHIKDNPFFSDSLLLEAKTSLLTFLKTDKITKDMIQNKYSEIILLLERILDGQNIEDTEDWHEQEILMSENKARIDSLFSVEFEIPSQWFPEKTLPGVGNAPRKSSGFKSKKKKNKRGTSSQDRAHKNGDSQTKEICSSDDIIPPPPEDNIPIPPPLTFDALEDIDLIPPPPPEDEMYDSYVPDTSIEDSPPPPPPDYDSIAGSDDEGFLFTAPDETLLSDSDNQKEVLEENIEENHEELYENDDMSSFSSENSCQDDEISELQEE